MIKRIMISVDGDKLYNIFKVWFFPVCLVIAVIVLIYINDVKNKEWISQQEKINILTQEVQSFKANTDALESTVVESKKASLVQFTDKDLMRDIIQSYPHISSAVKKEIVRTILEESVKYNINPLIIYSLLHTESSMRPWIEHTQVTVEIENKKVRVQAVGLGGVVWEWWGTKLKAAGIAEVRSDLFLPTVNIKATVFVYNELFKLDRHPKADNQDESAMIRYFGGGYKSYFEKIDNKIAQLVRAKLYRTEVIKTVVPVPVPSPK